MRKIVFLMLMFASWSLYGEPVADEPVTGENESNPQLPSSAVSPGRERNSNRTWSIQFYMGGGLQKLHSDQSFIATKDRVLEHRLLTIASNDPELRGYAAYYLSNKKDLPAPVQSGYASVGRVNVERRFLNLGLNIGITNGTYSFRSVKNPIYPLILMKTAYLFPSPNTPEGRSLYDFLLYEEKTKKKDSDNQDIGTGYSVQLADAGFSYHLSFDTTWDPYIQAGVRAGYNNGKILSPAYGAYGGMGIRYNISSSYTDRLFVFAGLEHQSLKLKVGGRTTPWLATNSANIGIGAYL